MKNWKTQCCKRQKISHFDPIDMPGFYKPMRFLKGALLLLIGTMAITRSYSQSSVCLRKSQLISFKESMASGVSGWVYQSGFSDSYETRADHGFFFGSQFPYETQFFSESSKGTEIGVYVTNDQIRLLVINPDFQ